MPEITVRRVGRDERGFALVPVIGTMTVLMLFLLTALSLVTNSTPPARRDQDAKAALAAAQAGIDEYVSRLNADDGYWLAGADAANPAFTAAGRTLPGTGGAGASYRYAYLSDRTETARDGVIRLRSTGTSRDVSRTLTAQLRPGGFLHYIYFTDLEGVDPARYRNTSRVEVDGVSSANGYFYRADPRKVDELCSRYWYAGRSNASYTSGGTYVAGGTAPYFRVSESNGTSQQMTDTRRITDVCDEIAFFGTDTINGPLHTNDVLWIAGPVQFLSPRTETSWRDDATPAPRPDSRWRETDTTTTLPNHKPVYAPPLPMPASNDELRSRADPLAGGVGCLYSGKTRFVFAGTKMRVLSPNTLQAPARCYNTSTATARETEQTVDIPPVVYVQGVTGSSCVDRIDYPRQGEDLSGPTTTSYACAEGNAFVQGTLSGRTTLAASNDIVVTGNLTYAGGVTGTDVLGLVAQDSVWVYHPVDTNKANLLSNAASPYEIDAAILAVDHGFGVQNSGHGASMSDPATGGRPLTVRGSIAQKYRGPVGSSSSSGRTGYTKNYVYDRRLANMQPPFFLRPSTSPWRVTKITDG